MSKQYKYLKDIKRVERWHSWFTKQNMCWTTALRFMLNVINNNAEAKVYVITAWTNAKISAGCLIFKYEFNL